MTNIEAMRLYNDSFKLGLHERLNQATRPTKSSPIAKISDP